jgi:hypothetical protein
MPFFVASALRLTPALLQPNKPFLILTLPFTGFNAAHSSDALMQCTAAWSSLLLLAFIWLRIVQAARVAVEYRGAEANLEYLRQIGTVLPAQIDDRPVSQLTSSALTYFGSLRRAIVDFAGWWSGGDFIPSVATGLLIAAEKSVIADESAQSFEFKNGTCGFSRLKAVGGVALLPEYTKEGCGEGA